MYTTTTAELRFIFRENTKGASTLEQSQWPNKALFRESPQKPGDTHAHTFVLRFRSSKRQWRKYSVRYKTVLSRVRVIIFDCTIQIYEKASINQNQLSIPSETN